MNEKRCKETNLYNTYYYNVEIFGMLFAMIQRVRVNSNR